MTTETSAPAYANGNTQSDSGGVVTEQPPPHATQPAYKKKLDVYRETTGTQEWLNGLFECFEGPDHLCLKTTFCPCFVYGKSMERIRDPALTTYNRFNFDCLAFAGLNFCGGWAFVLNYMLRKDIRSTHDIKGSALSDCLKSWCCHCCALIQQEKEIIGRQPPFASGGVGDNREGYTAPSEMVALSPGATQTQAPTQAQELTQVQPQTRNVGESTVAGLP